MRWSTAEFRLYDLQVACKGNDAPHRVPLGNEIVVVILVTR